MSVPCKRPGSARQRNHQRGQSVSAVKGRVFFSRANAKFALVSAEFCYLATHADLQASPRVAIPD